MMRSAAATNASYIRQCFHWRLVTRHLRQRIALELFQALLLRALAQVHPELQDERAIVGQRFLERRHAAELLVELRGLDAPMCTIQKRR